MIKSGQSVAIEFTTVSPETGELENADSLPTGALVVNGDDDAATVTVTNKATGIYKAAVTLPSLSAGDVVQLRVAATVFGIPGASVVWTETADTMWVSELDVTAQAILVDTGSALPSQIALIGSVPSGAGTGTGYYADTVDDGTNPLDGVRVQLYTGASRSGLAYEAHTNALGVFEMHPDPGVYYVFLDLAGYNFPQGTEVTVTEP